MRPGLAAAGGLAVALLMAAAVPAAAATPLDLATLSGERLAGPVDLSAFAPSPQAETLEGRIALRLALDTTNRRLTLKLRRDETADDAAARRARPTLPDFDFAFVAEGGVLIPLRRGVVESAHPAWDWVVEPGAVWREPGEAGWLRAALPVALQERNANCVHNGVLTFAFRPDGAVSKAALEFASETCAYLKFDGWGLFPARLDLSPASGADTVVAAYRAEVAGRLPVRPVSELAARYPGVDPGRLGLARPGDGDAPAAWGLVVDGVRYAGPCRTRHGDYPFCAALALPSYSTAKSIVGGVGLMRLEALRPGAAGRLVRDHVPACAQGRTWDGVTLADALDMATGVYTTAGSEADEGAADMSAFFAAPDHAFKAAYACRRHDRRAEPGRTFAYHTTDTYLLGAAMSDIARREGLGDLYADIVAPLWRDIGVGPTIGETRRALDAVRQPFTGWGLTYRADDIVRIAAWLSSGARIEGRPVLDEALLDAALQRDPANGGLSAGGPAYRYKGGFWARDIAPVVGCDRPLWVPFMSGYGGISVVLLPGDMTFYYFGDSGVFDWAPAAVEAARMKRICR